MNVTSTQSQDAIMHRANRVDFGAAFVELTDF